MVPLPPAPPPRGASPQLGHVSLTGFEPGTFSSQSDALSTVLNWLGPDLSFSQGRGGRACMEAAKCCFHSVLAAELFALCSPCHLTEFSQCFCELAPVLIL